jgi:hypothetical protein
VENKYRGLDKPIGSIGAKKLNYFRMKKEHLFLQAIRGVHDLVVMVCRLLL